MKISLDNILDDAMQDIGKAYEEAKKLEFVNDPIAYALYHTWKKYDGRSKQHERKT